MAYVYGPRQVGKTTLVNQIISFFSDKKCLYMTGDDIEIQSILQASINVLKNIVSGYELIVIDEAQRVKNIGLIIKLLVDNFPSIQVIATGSSSFDLVNNIVEPLTGRAIFYHLYPFSFQEIYTKLPITQIAIEQRMIYGSYPEVIIPKSQQVTEYLRMLVDQYLYKDVISFDGIKKHAIIVKLLQALALQIGSEVSYTELAQTIGADKMTIDKYIRILEQAFIIFRLTPLHSNQRREIKSHDKIYFRDLGVRNALINNFNPLSMRADVGALRENLFIVERSKYITYNKILHKQYFRRQTQGSEIDYIEQYGSQYDCYECKYSTKKGTSLPASFNQKYPQNSFTVVRPDTYHF